MAERTKKSQTPVGKREPTENNTEITQILEHWMHYLTKTLKEVKKNAPQEQILLKQMEN